MAGAEAAQIDAVQLVSDDRVACIGIADRTCGFELKRVEVLRQGRNRSSGLLMPARSHFFTRRILKAGAGGPACRYRRCQDEGAGDHHFFDEKWIKPRCPASSPVFRSA